MNDRFIGGSNPFKKSGTQFAKDQKEIRKLNKKQPKKKKVHSKNYRFIKIKSIDDFFEPPKKLKPVNRLKSTEIKDSVGESIIGDWLRKHGVKFIREKKFKDLLSPLSQQHLRMDFFLPDKKMCIEFDGKQHFKVCKRFDGDDKSLLVKRQFNDKHKDKFCTYRGFKMLRIPYNQINNIDKILCQNCL